MKKSTSGQIPCQNYNYGRQKKKPTRVSEIFSIFRNILHSICHSFAWLKVCSYIKLIEIPAKKIKLTKTAEIWLFEIYEENTF